MLQDVENRRLHCGEIYNIQGQRKAWRIPSPKNFTFDLENQ